MFDLTNKTAVVTGASRGVGRGIALGLGESGATVYVTGRTVEEGKGDAQLSGTIHQTAQEVTKMGGQGIAIHCDHGDDNDVEAAFQRIRSEQDRIDLLVNNVWGGYEGMVAEDGTYTWEEPFWQQPRWRWDAMFQTGVRAHFTSSVYAAQAMVEQRAGLIVNISFWSAQTYMGNVIYGVAKAATDRLTKDMAHELRPYNVAVVSLYPGLVRTERVMRAAEQLDLENSESPQFVGRAVAALLSDADVMDRTGQVVIAAALAQEYGFTDVDGKQPRPLSVRDD